MEEFILGNGAAQKLEPEEVRVEGGDAVRELKRSMLEGTKVQSIFLEFRLINSLESLLSKTTSASMHDFGRFLS